MRLGVAWRELAVTNAEMQQISTQNVRNDSANAFTIYEDLQFGSTGVCSDRPPGKTSAFIYSIE